MAGIDNPERVWNGPDGDDGSVHVVGNGLMAAYGCGPNLFNIFGPPYSGPSWGSLALADSGLTCRAWREPGTAIWHYRLADAQGNEVAEFTDLAVAGHALLTRHCRCRQPLNLSLRLADEKMRHFATTNPATRTIFSPRGRTYWWSYPLANPGICLVSATGAATLSAAEGNAMTIRLSAGDSLLTFAAEGTLSEATQTSEWAATVGWDGLLDRTRRHWAAAMAPLRPLLPAGELDPARLAWMVDSTAVQILAQQGLTGGVLAGHNYRMAYVRDGYGVLRGLLELGLHEAARAILEGYWRIFQVEGAIHNAQPIGFTRPFHIHEEDRSEITGYLVQQAADWIAATGDDSLIERLQPMFEWAIDRQLDILVDGALPFNGDETYVAGGMFPRERLCDHSAEATLLFCASTRSFSNWAARRGHWTPRRRDQVLAALGGAESAFHRHFMVDGRLNANDPARAALAPRFREGGLCERCGRSELGDFVSCERDAHGRYQCPACIGKGPLPPSVPRRYRIASAALTPAFIGDGPLSNDDVEREISLVAQSWSATGRLPSQEGEAGGRTVGYDYGFLLLGMDRLRHPQAGALARRTLDLLDPTGAWVEYYADGKPQGTRCRPWESAINCLAILRHLRDKNGMRKKP
jgi:hypothetical protein